MAAAIGIAGTTFYNYPKLNIISGYAAKNMASGIFVAGRSADDIAGNDNDVPLIKLAQSKANPEERSVVASVFGLMERKAVFRNGLGCVLVSDSYEPRQPYLQPNRYPSTNSLPFPYGNASSGDSLFKNIDYALLNKAMDGAFARPEVQKTRTAVVVYKDHVIAERYTEGFTEGTRILGWSMTKSILATLYGILEYQQKIDVQSFLPFKVYGDSTIRGTDPRKSITLDHLLRMQSGLEWDEDYTSISDVTKMLFLEADMTRSAADNDQVATPGEVWNYSSGTTNYLSGILRRRFGTYQEYLDFPYKELIDKIGMNSMVLEADMAGNYIGSSYGWANTRDWARFGLLYLHRGDWNGKQLFAPAWADYVAKPTAHSQGDYGAHFWLNAGGKYADVPKDLFSANGYQGQYVFIIPSKDLVIVRTGLAEAPDFDVNAFLEGIVDAVQ